LIDITLLRIQNEFLSALEKPWKEPHGLQRVLESCRQGKIKNRTECLFLEHGKEYGTVVLGIGTKDDDHRLFRDIDPLPDKELIRLIENIERFPKKASIVAFLDEFAQTPLGMTLPSTTLLVLSIHKRYCHEPTLSVSKTSKPKKRYITIYYSQVIADHG
jgi:hypothetical protein